MALIEELKERYAEIERRIEARNSQISEHCAAINALVAERIDLDKAIAALLDPIPQLPAEPSSQASPTDAADQLDALKTLTISPSTSTLETYTISSTTTTDAPSIPEGFTKWEGGYCPFDIGTHLEVLTRKNGVWPVMITPEAPLLWEHEGHDLDIIAYRFIDEPASDAERIGQDSLTAEGDRVEPEDLPPISDSEFQALPKFEEEPKEVISILTGDPAIEPESGLHGEPVPMVSELDSQGTPQASIEQSQDKPHPDVEFWSKALTQPPTEREQAQSLISKLFGAPKPKLEDA